MAGRWARLCAAFFLIGLAASRLTLVLHELAGHGGAVALLAAVTLGSLVLVALLEMLA